MWGPRERGITEILLSWADICAYKNENVIFKLAPSEDLSCFSSGPFFLSSLLSASSGYKVGSFFSPLFFSCIKHSTFQAAFVFHILTFLHLGENLDYSALHMFFTLHVFTGEIFIHQTWRLLYRHIFISVKVLLGNFLKSSCG